MSKDTKIVIGIAGDTKSFEKSLEQAARKLERTSKSTKTVKKDVTGLGDSFSQAANSVTIFNGQLDPISGRLSAIGTGITRFGVGNIGLAAGVTTATLAIGKAIVAADKYEKRQLRFNSLLNATSHSSKLAAKDLEALANQIGKDTLSNTEEASEGINALLTFRKVQGANFKETVKLARDAQVAFGGNLREGVVAFGKALNDPIANLGALSRKGIQFNEEQKKMIKDFWEMGDAASAQNVILDEMRKQFGGLATQEAKTLEGAVDGLSHAWDRVWESAGRTGYVKDVINQLEFAANQYSKALDSVSEAHSEESKQIEEKARLTEYLTSLNNRYRIALDKQNKAIADGENPNQIKYLKSMSSILLEEVVKATEELAVFEIKKDNIDSRIRKKQEKADKLIAAQEKTAQLAKYEEIVKNGDKILLSVTSRYESERAKLDRFKSDSVKALNDQRDKEIEIATKTGGDLSAIRAKYRKAIELVETGHQDKLDKLNKREADRAIAAENRIRRATEVELSNQRKREKLLSSIRGDTSKTAGITEKYEQQLAILKATNFSEIEVVKAGFETKEQLQESYQALLKHNYDKDLEDFINTENAKTLKVQEESAKRAAERFGENVDQRFAGVENGAGGFQDFMGVNVGEFENKQAELYAAKETAIAEILALGLSADEEEMRSAAVLTQFKIRQAKLEKDAKTKATDDTWNAMSTLGASGSKKLFAINKAANIAKAVMNTYTGATNALASLPPPYNIAAASLITAAGFVNVRNIKNEPMPQFHDGITTVERTGSYLLQGGERVMTAKLNADLKEDLKNRKEGKSGGDTNVNLTLPDTGSYSATEQWYEDNSDRIIRHVKYAMNRP